MKSKIFEYLEIPESVSDTFPEDIREFVAIIEGSQEIYSQSTDSSKKEALAGLIVGWMRQLMEFLKTQNLGIYAMQNVDLEQKTLPKEKEKPKETKPKPPKPKPPKEEPRTPEPRTPEPPKPEPPKEEHKPPFTKEELEDAIATVQILAEIGDEESIRELKHLQDLYTKYYS
jgi:hypothetical protein